MSVSKVAGCGLCHFYRKTGDGVICYKYIAPGVSDIFDACIDICLKRC